MHFTVGDQQRCIRIGQHKGESLFGVVRIKRHVDRARLQDRQRGDDGFDRALKAKAHKIAGRHALGDQGVSKLIGAGVNVGVRELRVVEHECGGDGSRGYLLCK